MVLRRSAFCSSAVSPDFPAPLEWLDILWPLAFGSLQNHDTSQPP
jgi:hypothetical protein